MPMRLMWIIGGVVAVLMAVSVRYYVSWERGDDIRIPGVGVVRRFPCADYDVPPSGYGTTQAFAVIDGAAFAARSNKRAAVRTLVDAIFDRELPHVRCGNHLRQRVNDAEWQFRIGTKPPITEVALVDAANNVLPSSGAPPWARTSVGEVHFMRMALREEVPRLVGTVDGDRQLSEKMSPIEAVFVAMTIGRGMAWDPTEFQDGPEAYVARARERLLNPPRTGPVLRTRVMARGTLDVASGDGLDDRRALPAQAAQRFLDQLGFPRE
jgi:hypothetical protein